MKAGTHKKAGTHRKENETMKKAIVIIIMVMVALTATAAPVSAATTDKGLVKAYCMKKYHKAPKYVKEGSKAVLKHKGKMIVEIVKSTSKGTWGKTKDGYAIRYSKKVKKGKKVTSYLIYSPRNNAPDGIVAVVDNKRIK